MMTHTFSRREEIANAITHGIGAVLSVGMLVMLVVFASLEGNAWHVVSVSIYGVTMLVLFVSSTLVHSFPAGKMKDLFEIFDHSAIYLFIAGTYTPILLVPLRGSLGWTLFGIIWGMAILGIIFKVFFVKRFVVLSTLFYVLMGWLLIIAWGPLTTEVPAAGITYLILGGVMYSIGSIFYVWRSFTYHHMVWHLFVLGGSIFHFFTIFFYVI
ncbi:MULTISPECIES: PAQR family membrane homeostasis protein TrhA [Halobacillus]|uniref:Hemolysin III family protein n=1 Tax=Halobacillus halophilus (strain ATCC 35676 / DSM 2266 / JCM 20832 / KCTC 3685 / LMG 17431 / NBRC 102448 / NCIMB 2269) TaxID=866895 RepID=I0JLW4_HALH3|nr:hemolysin III family protein [Halobacillus halophilus]ASF39234.1 hemolysin D [Halobacillus halophilus]CCG45134.1 hemolysin III family protein [Halobacillus halophilus DSM 2266]